MGAVEFRQFTKRNGEFVLKDLSFRIEAGYITGLIGPNGSGKTTLIRSIMNLIRPDTGEVLLFGQPYREDERAIKRRIGFVYDDDFFYNHLTVREMKAIAASFYPSWNDEAFRRYADSFGLPAKRKVRDLSKGMKTKFALAAALAHEPELLIMDEPTSGLDPLFRREILAILSDYIRDGSRTVLFSTHNSADLERIADYIVYLRNGRLAFNGSKEELIDSYWIVKGPLELLHSRPWRLIGTQRSELGFEGLLTRADYSESLSELPVVLERPSLEDIMVFTKESGE